MNNELTEKIIKLTGQDQKSLVEKALKTCEEAGELAGAVLSYTGAHGNVYKGKVRDDVLKEAADVIICALSVVIQLGGELKELEEAIEIKAEKWARVLEIKE